jgi:hypothetical protein
MDPGVAWGTHAPSYLQKSFEIDHEILQFGKHV